jgi:hypothetical protein
MLENDLDMNEMMLAPDVVPYTSDGFIKAGVIPPPSPATRHRWRLSGLKGQRIQTFLRGGRRYTTIRAINAFFMAVNNVADKTHQHGHASKTRHIGLRNALAELRKDGI